MINLPAMKKRYQLVGLSFLFYSAAFAQNSERFMVGAASAEINPDTGSYIAGGDQNRKFTSIHDSLYIKAVVISNSETSITLFTADNIGYMYPQLLQVRQAVSKLLPNFPVNHIVMSSTHTHSGPDVVGLWGADQLHSGVDTNYIKKFVRVAAGVIVQAYSSRRPGLAQYANTAHGQGWVENISQPAELDRSVTILRFVDRRQRNIVTLTNFACHPTVLDGSSGAVSADYIAGYYELLNKSQGGINMFLQGAIGGWVQPEKVPKTINAAYEKGYGLANAVMSALRNPQYLETNSLGFKRKLLNLPVGNPGFRQLSAMHVINRSIGDSVLTEVAIFNIGEARFATHPGESVPAMSIATKLMLKTGGPVFVLGLGMDALGYILKPEFFDSTLQIPHSDYLRSMSVGVATRDLVMAAIDELSRE
jgi:hypothetical protein